MEVIIAAFKLKQRQAIYTSASLNGKNGRDFKFRLAIDTGAYDTIINKKRAETLGFSFKRGSTKNILSATAKETVDIITLESLQVSNYVKHNFKVICKDMPETLSVDGILGRNFFEDRILIFDFIRGNVSINIDTEALL